VSPTTTPRVAVIGAGTIGRGWATLVVAHGWEVAIFDATTSIAEDARAEVTERVRQLHRVGLANETDAHLGITAFRTGRSLLQTVTDADWIIEACPDDLALRQRSLEQVEQVCRMAAVLTSSSQKYHASDLCARLRRPERLLCVNPLPPVEYMPVVEVVPSPLTAPSCTDQVRLWLGRLGRIPVVLHREVPGNLGGRLVAAVWRECIHLVLEGVVSVEDLDRAVAAGPAVAWTAAGPHLGQYLAAGRRDLNVHLSDLLGTHEQWWKDLSNRDHLDADEQHRLVRALERAYSARLPVLRGERERRLMLLLHALTRP